MYDGMQLKPVGETYNITIGTTITSLPTFPAGAVRCRILVESADIRCKFNATDSTTYAVTSIVGGGMILHANTIANPYHIIEGWDFMNRMRMVRAGSTNSMISVVFEGYDIQDPYNGGKA